MGPTAPPNRLGRPGSSLYLIDSIGVSSSYRLSRPIRPTYVLRICLSPPALKTGGAPCHTIIILYQILPTWYCAYLVLYNTRTNTNSPLALALVLP